MPVFAIRAIGLRVTTPSFPEPELLSLSSLPLLEAESRPLVVDDRTGSFRVLMVFCVSATLSCMRVFF